MARLDKVKQEIKRQYEDGAVCGIFFTRNWVGDPMTTVYEEDGVTIDNCYHYSYLEVFGLNDDEQREVEDYYNSLRKAF